MRFLLVLSITLTTGCLTVSCGERSPQKSHSVEHDTTKMYLSQLEKHYVEIKNNQQNKELVFTRAIDVLNSIEDWQSSSEGARLQKRMKQCAPKKHRMVRQLAKYANRNMLLGIAVSEKGHTHKGNKLVTQGVLDYVRLLREFATPKKLCRSANGQKQNNLSI